MRDSRGPLLQCQCLHHGCAEPALRVVVFHDNQKDVYAGFKNGDKFAGIHAGNGDLAGIMIIILVILSFAARQPWRTTILSGVLFVLIFLQSILAHTGIALLSALHGVNALFLIGLTGYLTGANWAFRRPASAGVTPP